MTAVHLAKWYGAAGWEIVLNQSGTTFRKLPEAERQNLTQDKTITLMIGNPSMIKPPVLDSGSALEIGLERCTAVFGA